MIEVGVIIALARGLVWFPEPMQQLTNACNSYSKGLDTFWLLHTHTIN